MLNTGCKPKRKIVSNEDRYAIDGWKRSAATITTPITKQRKIASREEERKLILKYLPWYDMWWNDFAVVIFYFHCGVLFRSECVG